MFRVTWRVIVSSVLLASVLAFVPEVSTATGTPGSVVISELHYHPTDAAGDSEFLELANASGSPVDISGWVIGDGIDPFTFPNATTLDVGERLVVTQLQTAFFGVYGFEASGQYSGALSNGGERITLTDETGVGIDSVEYDDKDAWPSAPDGSGPSLELVDLGSDNNDAANWRPSRTAGGTPGAVNTAELPPPAVPEFGTVAVEPSRPEPLEDIDVQVTVDDATTATIAYKVDFGDEILVPLLDDAGSPGGAGDGVYGATIPGQAAGALVRYRLMAGNDVGVVTLPSASEAITYRGVVVLDPSRQTALPVVEWWMEDGVYNDLRANHRFDDVSGPAVVAYDGIVYDNVQMNVRGGHSRNLDHNSWKVVFPAGTLFDMPGLISMPVDEFNMQWDAQPVAATAWDIMNQIGFPRVDYFPIRTYRNGEFWSTGSYGTAADGRWRDANGFGDDNVYKSAGYPALERRDTPEQTGANLELKEGDDEDFEKVWAFSQGISSGTEAENLDYLLEHLDLPKVINYLAVAGYLKHWDIAHHNWYLVNDQGDTDRWFMLPWDLDAVFRTNAQLGSIGDYLTPDRGALPDAVLAHPEFEAMYFRRLKSLIDQLPLPDYPDDVYDAFYDPMAAELQENYLKWRQYGKPSGRAKQFHDGTRERDRFFDSKTGGSNTRPIPRSQTAARPIVISEIHFAPEPGGAEFVELTNTDTKESFDLSGWVIEGIDHTIQPGTILLPGQRVVFTSDDVAFRAAYGPAFVGGQIEEGLPDDGTTLRLLDASGARVDDVTYGVDDPWPWTAAGHGPSLELIDLNADNAQAANWAPSSVVGGTPGLTNQPDGSPLPPRPNPGLILNEYNAVSDSKLLGGGTAQDAYFGSVAGNGGDWFELVVVEEGLDARGWRLDWTDSSESGSLVLTDDPLWSALPAGTIITVSEDVADDSSLEPGTGDWWINAQATDGASGTLVTASDFSVTNSDWQLTIRDASGTARFGPAGEGIGDLSGIGSDEVAQLQDDPSASVTASSAYDEAINSSFGAPNPVAEGTAQSFAVLRNAIPATVITDPTDTTVVVGDTAHLSVTAEGNAPITYQWHRAGIDIPGATSSTLDIGPVDMDDDGAVFDVLVSNAFGSTTSAPATLTVTQQPPRVTDGLLALWTFDEGSGSVIHDTSGAGTPVDLAIEDAGRVEWIPGGGVSVADYVEIASPAPATKLSSATITNQEVTLEAWVDPTATSTTQPGWIAGLIDSKNSRDLVLAHGFWVGQPSDASEARVRTSTSGNYRVQAPARSLDDDLVHLIVTHDTGGTTTLYQDGVAVATSHTTGSLNWRDQRFRIGSAGPSSPATMFAGDIFLVAYYGRALEPTEILTNFEAGPAGEPPADAAPVITTQPTDTAAVVGDTATFQVVATGIPDPSYQWRLDGIDLPGADGSNLTIGPVSLADHGVVLDVVVTNTEGSVTSEVATLSITEAPTGPPRVAFVAGSSPPPKKDTGVIDHLISLGYDVAVIDDATIDASTTFTGFDLVIVASSVLPTEVADMPVDLAVPMLVWEAYLYDELAMSTSGSRDSKTAEDRLQIDLPSHPLAGGLSGSVGVLSAAVPVAIAVPGAGADVVASTLNGQPAIFAYDAGDTLADGSSAAAARVGFFLSFDAGTVITDAGWTLLDAAVTWLAPI